MVVGQLAYTVDNVNKKVDTWVYVGVMKTKDGVLYELRYGNKTVWLPKNCVFDSIEKAQKILNL